MAFPTMQGNERMIDALFETLAAAGERQYGGEHVSQLEHALQAAALAEAENAPPALITAALLHDIGHLLHALGPLPAARGIDDRHELIAARQLAKRFGPEVSEPVRLHVDAKRWLCAVEPDYFAMLSAASVRSLAVQGGPFTAEESGAFSCLPHAEGAVRMRRWDDQAKVRGLATPSLAYFRRYVEAAAARP
jgi:phosphonate degradation associated HDIG domain protein